MMNLADMNYAHYWNWWGLVVLLTFAIPEGYALYLGGERTLSHQVIAFMADHAWSKALMVFVLLWLIGHWVALKW
jgi:hypothetical protein